MAERMHPAHTGARSWPFTLRPRLGSCGMHRRLGCSAALALPIAGLRSGLFIVLQLRGTRSDRG